MFEYPEYFIADIGEPPKRLVGSSDHANQGAAIDSLPPPPLVDTGPRMKGDGSTAGPAAQASVRALRVRCEKRRDMTLA